MLGKNISSALDDLAHSAVWAVGPNLDIASTQMRFPSIKSSLEMKGKASSPARKSAKTDIVTSYVSRVAFFSGE